jgi:CheY-like chemotaxis protein
VIGLEVTGEDSLGVELHGWVRDTGVGLTQEQQSRLFQPFMQVDSSTTRRFGGTGLGLVISRQLIERMGGRLWVVSEGGRGSTFHFSARFGRGPQRARQQAAPIEALRGRRALLVDDNAAARTLIGGMLERLGLRVEHAASGAQALERVARDPAGYAWILLDWKMPGMDGVTCARRLMQAHPGLHGCILLVSAFAREDAVRAAGDVPLADVLGKPVTPTNLLASLLRAERPDAHPDTGGGRMHDSDATRSRLAGARILLAEDHPLNQELACELLRRAEMEVVVAENGEEALRKLATEGPFDGVLMDCQMPVMDGYTATRRLRANPAFEHLPVIAMTASALAEDRDRALAAGMNAHIAKPLNVGQMLRTMADWIVSRRAPTLGEDGGPYTDWSPGDGMGPIDTADGLARCLGKAHLYRPHPARLSRRQRRFLGHRRCGAARRGLGPGHPSRARPQGSGRHDRRPRSAERVAGSALGPERPRCHLRGQLVRPRQRRTRRGAARDRPPRRGGLSARVATRPEA